MSGFGAEPQLINPQIIQKTPKSIPEKQLESKEDDGTKDLTGIPAPKPDIITDKGAKLGQDASTDDGQRGTDPSGPVDSGALGDRTSEVDEADEGKRPVRGGSTTGTTGVRKDNGGSKRPTKPAMGERQGGGTTDLGVSTGQRERR